MQRALAYTALWLMALAWFGTGASPATAQPVLTDSLYLAHHPRLLFTKADVPALRAKIHDGGHDDEAYVSLRDYVQLVYSAQTPGIVLGTSFGVGAVPCIGLVAFLETPPDSFAMAQGKDLTMFIANAYSPNLDEGNSGLRLRALALGYDLFFENATDFERGYIRDEIMLYVNLMTTSWAYRAFEYRPYLGNHSAMFGAALGLAAICLDGEADATALSNAIAMADRITASLFQYQFDPGGAYNEGGLYALWTLRNLIYYFDARKRFDGTDFSANPILRAVEQWLPYEFLHDGLGKTHNLNDSPFSSTPFARSTTYFDWAMSEWSSGLSSWMWEYTAGAHGVDLGMESDQAGTVLWHRPTPPLHPNLALPRHRIWEQRGLYHFRTGWQTATRSKNDVLFNFYSGKFQGGHAQEDQNQFALYAYGAKFAIDHGSGGSAKESDAHNMVFIDGNGQHNAGSSIGTDGRIAEYLLGGSADYIVGDATQAYTTYSEFNEFGVPFPNTDWSWGHFGANPVQFAYRRVLVVHGNDAPPYFVIMDDIDKDGLSHEYQWRMHTLSTHAVNTSATPWTITDGDATLEVHALNPPAGTMLVSTLGYNNFNDDPDARVLRISTTAVDPRFSFLLVPRTGTLPSPVVARAAYAWGYAVAIDWGAGIVDYLLRNDSGELAQHNEIQSDGLVTWVRTVDGGVDSYLATGVRSLSIGATEYAAFLDGPATCEMSGNVVEIDREDADFRFFDNGIAKVSWRGLGLAFALAGGYVTAAGATAVEDRPPPRAGLAIAAYPNPFNPTTTIRIDGVLGERVRVLVYDVAGRFVRQLWDAPLPSASASVVWDGRDQRAVPVASGTYFLRASTATASRTLKLTLLK